MATLTATRAAASFPVAGHSGLGGTLKQAHGTYAFTANPTAGDVVELCKIPEGAVVTGGRLYVSDMDTNGTPTLDIDCGWKANGVDAADSDGFGNNGVLNGTAVTNYTPAGGTILPLQGVLIADGPKTFSAETTITATIVAVAATFAAGRISVTVDYLTP